MYIAKVPFSIFTAFLLYISLYEHVAEFKLGNSDFEQFIYDSIFDTIQVKPEADMFIHIISGFDILRPL